MEIFYRYDIDLNEDDDLDFGDLLEKVLVLVKRRKYLLELIQDKETEADKYNPQEKVFTAPDIVEPFLYPVQDFVLPTRCNTVQGGVQKDIPLVRIHASQIGKAEAGEVSSGADDCMLISDPAEDFNEDLGTLFPDLKPGDKKAGQLCVDSVTVVKPFDDTIGLRRCAHRPDSSNKRTRWKSFNSYDTGIGARKKAGMRLEEGHTGFDGIVIGRGVIKSDDHC